MSFIVKTWTPGRADLALLLLVEITNADEHGLRWRDRRRRSDGRELIRLLAEQGRERHPVHVAGVGGLRRVHVAVRVHPDQSKRIRGHATNVIGARRDRASRQAVIAAEHQRQCVCLVRSQRDVIQAAAHAGDLVDVLLRRIDGLRRFGNR
jgi:hypothetical protein